MKRREAANATTIKLMISFLTLFAIHENMVALTAAIIPTTRAVPSPPVIIKNKTTSSAPADAPIKSAAYNLPATLEKALKAADMMIPIKKNGTAKRIKNKGR